MSLNELELELRKLPGVRSTGFSERDDVLFVQVHTGDNPAPNLALQATRIATRHSERSVAVELIRWRTAGTAPAPAHETVTPHAAPRADAPARNGDTHVDLIQDEAVEDGAEALREAATSDVEQEIELEIVSEFESSVGETYSEVHSEVHAEVRSNVETETATETATETEPVVDPDLDQIVERLSDPEAELERALGPDARADDDDQPRVQLLAVLSFPNTDELEVHLTLGGRRSIGRAAASRGLIGAVEATVEAVRAFTDALPFTPGWARTIETTAGGQFLVATSVVAPELDASRYGLAAGNSPTEAAARATLHALNRTLAHGPHAGIS